MVLLRTDSSAITWVQKLTIGGRLDVQRLRDRVDNPAQKSNFLRCASDPRAPLRMLIRRV